jgi:transketolase
MVVHMNNLASARETYGDTLAELGDSNPYIVVVDADLSISTQTSRFSKKFPRRFVNVGCAEQNLIGTASGLAIAGKTVFASTYAIFLCRAWEQIRNTVAHDKLNVKIVVTHAGLSNASDGASHQSLEDIALMRVIPNMRVIVPSDAVQTREVVRYEASHPGPAYIRLNREKTPNIFEKDYIFNDNALELCAGKDVAIVAMGSMVHEALKASVLLKREHISASVIEVHTIKPLDTSSILQAAKMCGAVLTIEEHSKIGGLGSAVAEFLCTNYPVPMAILGINDRFGESGQYHELLEKNRILDKFIVGDVTNLLEKK